MSRLALPLRRLAGAVGVAAALFCFWTAGAASQAREPERPAAATAQALAPMVAATAAERPLRVMVVGDSLARNLFDGLRSVWRRAPGVSFKRRTKAATGLVRDDRFDWQAAAEEIAQTSGADAYLIIIGGNDRQDIREQTRRDGQLRRVRHRRFTDDWRAAYARRAARFAATLSERGARLYWVSLPIVRSGRMSRDYAGMNAIYRRAVDQVGGVYIDVYEAFRGPDGGYASHGPGVDGTTRRLRDDDGLHFSMGGSVLLARMVADRVEADMARAAELAAQQAAAGRRR